MVAAIQTISQTRKGLVIQEAWEKEEEAGSKVMSQSSKKSCQLYG